MKLGNILDAVAKTVDAAADARNAKYALQTEMQKEQFKSKLKEQADIEEYRAENPEYAMREDAVKRAMASQNNPNNQIPNAPQIQPTVPQAGPQGPIQPKPQPMPGQAPAGQPVAPGGQPQPTPQPAQPPAQPTAQPPQPTQPQWDATSYMGNFLRTPQVNTETGKIGAPTPLQIYSELAKIKQASQNPANNIKWDKGNEDMLRAAGEKAGVMTKQAANSSMGLQMPNIPLPAYGASQEQKNAYLEQVGKSDPNLREIIHSIATYDAEDSLISSYSRGQGGLTRAQLFGLARLENPSLSEPEYKARQKARVSFTDPNGATQKNIISLNTLSHHIRTGMETEEELKNTGAPAVNSFINFAKEWTGDPTITNFRTAKEAIINESQRAFAGVGATQEGIKRAVSTLPDNASHAQMSGFFKTMGRLMKGRMNPLENQYRRSVLGGQGDIPEGLVFQPGTREDLDFVENGGMNNVLSTQNLKPGESTTYNGAKITAR